MNRIVTSCVLGLVTLPFLLACGANPQSSSDPVGTVVQKGSSSVGSTPHAELAVMNTCNGNGASAVCTQTIYHPTDNIDDVMNSWGFPTSISDGLAPGATSGNIEVRYYDTSYLQLTIADVFSSTTLPKHTPTQMTPYISMLDSTSRQWVAQWGTGWQGGSVTYTVYYQKSDQSCSLWHQINPTADSKWNWYGGSTSTCAEGRDSIGSSSAATLVNLYRTVAGLPPVQNYSLGGMDAQSCALMQMANPNTTDNRHDPPSSWNCWTQAGHDAAANANIATSGAVQGIKDFMTENNGDITNLGHRQYILSQSLYGVDIGSTGTYSCMVHGMASGPYQGGYVAWPSGYVPGSSLNFPGAIDIPGWSIQSSDAQYSDLCASPNIQITVNRYKYDVPRQNGTFTYGRSQISCLANYAATYAIKFIPQWSTRTLEPQWYHVSVRGIANPIDYDVNIVYCGYYGT